MGGYVIGVDGGGTKTHYALYNPQLGKLDLLQEGPSNHENMPGSFAELKQVLGKNLNTLLARNALEMSDVDIGVFGLGGVDTSRQADNISRVLTELGLKQFILCNDAYLGVKAGTVSGCGVCVICGSGGSVAAIDSAGRRIQIGGIGAISGDFGGGNCALVPNAIGCVYNELFRGHIKTMLTPLLFELLSIHDKRAMMDAITDRLIENEKCFTLAVSKLLFVAAGQGDEAALTLLKRSGVNYGEAVVGAVRELSFSKSEPVEIVFAGSLFVKEPLTTIRDALQTTLEALLPEFRFEYKLLCIPCVMGALLWALNELGVPGDRTDIEIKLLNHM